jgi:hypothetical protein
LTVTLIWLIALIALYFAYTLMSFGVAQSLTKFSHPTLRFPTPMVN